MKSVLSSCRVNELYQILSPLPIINKLGPKPQLSLFFLPQVPSMTYGHVVSS